VKFNEQKQGEDNNKDNTQNLVNNISGVTSSVSNDLEKNKSNKMQESNLFKELDGKVNNDDLYKIKEISENFHHSMKTMNQIINSPNQQHTSKDKLCDTNNTEKYIFNTANQVYNNERGR